MSYRDYLVLMLSSMEDCAQDDHHYAGAGETDQRRHYTINSTEDLAYALAAARGRVS